MCVGRPIEQGEKFSVKFDVRLSNKDPEKFTLFINALDTSTPVIETVTPANKGGTVHRIIGTVRSSDPPFAPVTDANNGGIVVVGINTGPNASLALNGKIGPNGQLQALDGQNLVYTGKNENGKDEIVIKAEWIDKNGKKQIAGPRKFFKDWKKVP